MIRKAILAELDQIDQIALNAISNMKKSGIKQWDDNYPRYEHFAKDIENGILFVCERNKEIYGVMALMLQQDSAYLTISSWITSPENSLVIHRVVVDPKHARTGVFEELLMFAKDHAKKNQKTAIKIDTHDSNYKMRSFLEKHGFRHVGYLESIDRQAYELILD
jgi:GNAT superfamily N-acetyltransferase